MSMWCVITHKDTHCGGNQVPQTINLKVTNLAPTFLVKSSVTKYKNMILASTLSSVWILGIEFTLITKI